VLHCCQVCFKRASTYPSSLTAECIYGRIDCGARATCVPHGPGYSGTCQCESFFGFHGPTCEELSSATLLMVVLCLLTIVHSCFAVGVSLMHYKDP